MVVCAALLLVAVDYVAEFILIDACLDRGGAFNFQEMVCSTDPNGPTTFEFRSYPSRNRHFLIIVGFASLAVAVVVTILRKPVLWR